MRSDEAMFKLIRKYGMRRAVVLFGAAAVAAQRGWDALVADDGYTRQGVWNWKNDLKLAGIDITKVEWTGLESKLGRDVGEGFQLSKVQVRQKKAAAASRAARPRAST